MQEVVERGGQCRGGRSLTTIELLEALDKDFEDLRRLNAPGYE